MSPPTPPPASHGPAPAWRLGGLRVHLIDETALPASTGPMLLPGASPHLVRHVPWLRPDFADDAGILRLASHSFAVEAGGLRIVVDTGIGNGKTRADPAWHQLNTDYLQRLRRAGFAPDTVDLVVLTHLHTDHVGWNTRAEGGTWVPTFPHARYLTSAAEWDYWAAAPVDPPHRQVLRDSLHPIRDAGLLEVIDVPAATGPGGTGVEVAPGVRLFATPGHTPGQVAVELGGTDRCAVITGDCIHHPVQIAHPHITSSVDTDAEQAVCSRRALLAALCDTGVLVLGTHFPPPTAGTVASEAGTYRLVPAPGHTPTT
ncbi:glyoxylase-like metal-dependent hydrolase (beta-lactamase superfamily II) [Streptomyces sp. 3212.3]|uniref:MBL fold metallo-hydrolase n=1 Tax=Streptomyces sp. 3212.3 TaxID=1938846 RepID=UPI000E21D329|nr:MBL fold metallo-hydrolase [Streptomyces sp. 3212.3]REE66174.1 glyoxylase-like metal-dependent hydrolase (beta-lactamase superfamily II) [Streptomyces sp. 3212.3]